MKKFFGQLLKRNSLLIVFHAKDQTHVCSLKRRRLIRFRCIYRQRLKSESVQAFVLG